MNLRFKLLALVATAVAVPVIALLVVFEIESDAAEEAIAAEVRGQLVGEMAGLQKSVQGIVAVGDSALRQKVDSDLSVARDVLRRGGGAHLDSSTPVRWDAVDQFSKAVSRVQLPRLLVGERWLGQVRSFDEASLVVDEVQGLVGGTATIFQRMNEAGDMLRVATNVRKLDGTRAIGTYIPAKNPDGSPNAVVSTVMRKETFKGRAYVVNAWYITAYEPILDPAGEVVGVLYVGVKQDEVDTVRSGIANLRIGASGYVSALPVSGLGAGQFVMSGDRAREGQDAAARLDVDGQPYYTAVLEAASKLSAGEVGQTTAWIPGPDGARQEVLLSYTYFAPWKWAIVGEAYFDEHDEAVHASRAHFAALRAQMIGLGLLCGLVTMIVATFRVRSVTRPLGHAVHALEDVAEGDADLTAQLEAGTDDEVGRLAGAFNRFVEKLDSTVRAVAGGAGQIRVGVEDLQGASKELSRQASEVRSYTGSVRSAVEEVAGTFGRSSTVSLEASERMQHLAQATQSVEGDARGILEQSQETSASMVAVAAALEQMSSALDEVARGAAGTAHAGEEAEQQALDAKARMQGLTDATRNISRVVELIQAIADQTNLLALNATIEAAGAGEAGRGFAVVAGEVKQLAGQTASATEEISKEVQGIQRDAADTAQSIERVSESVKHVAQLAHQIAAATEEQTSTNAEIAHNVNRASSAAQTISDAVERITAAIEQMAQDSSSASAGVEEIAAFNASIDAAVQQVVESLAALDGVAGSAEGAAQRVRDRADGIHAQSFELSAEVGRFKTRALA